MRETRTLRLTWRGLETWHGRDAVTLADERASQQGTQTSAYTGAPVPDPTDERDVETELRRGYSGTARRKGRQQTNQTYRHRATFRLYQLPAVHDGQISGDLRVRHIGQQAARNSQ